MKSKISLILFLITVPFHYSQSDVRVISSDFNSITIEYSPSFIDTSLVSIDGKEFRKAEVFLGTLKNYDDWGSPSIIERRINVGVPSEFGNTIEVLSYAYKEIFGQIIPVPYTIYDSLSVSFNYKQNSEYFSFKADEDLVTFGDYGLVRDVGSQTINISPVKFDAALNKIKVYSKIVFKVNFNNSGILSSKPADDLLDGVLINYSVAKFWNNKTADKNLNKVTVTNSVLANGKWVRFEAPEEGIYKIAKANLSSFGIDPNTVDPRTIKIYNNGGKALPENITVPRPNDLEENAIIVVGQEDSVFNDADYILFYGRGSSFWDYDSDGSTIKRFNHPYSLKNYFWITSGGSNGKRMSEKSGLNSTPTFNQTTTTAYADWEVDKINLGKTGRQFVGDNFSSSITSRTYTNTLSGRISTTPINYNVRFVVGSETGVTLVVKENGNQIFSSNLSGYGSASYTAGREYNYSMTFDGSLVDNRSILNFNANPSSITSNGFLDYFTIRYEKELKAFSDNLIFFSNPSDDIIKYSLSDFSSSNIRVFDITNYSNPKTIQLDGVSGGQCWFQFNESATQRSKYCAVGIAGFKTRPLIQLRYKILIYTEKKKAQSLS